MLQPGRRFRDAGVHVFDLSSTGARMCFSRLFASSRAIDWYRIRSFARSAMVWSKGARVFDWIVRDGKGTEAMAVGMPFTLGRPPEFSAQKQAVATSVAAGANMHKFGRFEIADGFSARTSRFRVFFGGNAVTRQIST